MPSGERPVGGAASVQRPLPTRNAGSSPVRSTPRQASSSGGERGQWARSHGGDYGNTNSTDRPRGSYHESGSNQRRPRSMGSPTDVATTVPVGDGDDHHHDEQPVGIGNSGRSDTRGLRGAAVTAAGGELNRRWSEDGISTAPEKPDSGGSGGISRSAAEFRGRVGLLGSGVDRGLAGVGLSSSSSCSLWALPPPPPPSGNAVPALLSHLAGWFLWCFSSRMSLQAFLALVRGPCRRLLCLILDLLKFEFCGQIQYHVWHYPLYI